MLVTTPRVPAERLTFLQEAVRKMVRDPTLLAEAEKTQRYIDYRDPDAAARRDRAGHLLAPTVGQRAEMQAHRAAANMPGST